MSFYQGLQQFKKQNYPSAIEHFKSSIKQNNQPILSLLYKGKSQYNMHKFQSAKQSFTEILKRDSNSVQAYTQLGAVETAFGNYDKAFQNFKKSLLYDQKYWKTYFYKGYTEWRRENYSSSLSSLSKAVTFNSLNNPKVYIGIAASACKMEQFIIAKRQMEYAKKAMTIKENLEELTKSEIVLINDGLKRYEKWGELLEIDLGMSKQKTNIYVNYVNQLFKSVYLNNHEVWKNAVYKTDLQISFAISNQNLDQGGKCECDCKII